MKKEQNWFATKEYNNNTTNVHHNNHNITSKVDRSRGKQQMRILQQNGKTHRKALAGECGFSSAAHAGEGSCCSEQQLQMKDEDEQLY